MIEYKGEAYHPPVGDAEIVAPRFDRVERDEHAIETLMRVDDSYYYRRSHMNGYVFWKRVDEESDYQPPARPEFDDNHRVPQYMEPVLEALLQKLLDGRNLAEMPSLDPFPHYDG